MAPMGEDPSLWSRDQSLESQLRKAKLGNRQGLDPHPPCLGITQDYRVCGSHLGNWKEAEGVGKAVQELLNFYPVTRFQSICR